MIVSHEVNRKRSLTKDRAIKRFLMTGNKVGLESSNPIPPVKTFSPLSKNINSKPQTFKSVPREASAALYQAGQKGAGGGGGLNRRGSISEYLTEIPGWRMDEFLNLPDLDNAYRFEEAGSSKADNASFGEIEWTTSSLEADVENCLAQVPEMPSPPTASGLYWPQRVIRDPTEGKRREDLGILEFDDTPLVPDILCRSSPPDSPLSKRRRLSV